MGREGRVCLGTKITKPLKERLVTPPNWLSSGSTRLEMKRPTRPASTGRRRGCNGHLCGQGGPGAPRSSRNRRRTGMDQEWSPLPWRISQPSPQLQQPRNSSFKSTLLDQRKVRKCGLRDSRRRCPAPSSQSEESEVVNTVLRGPWALSP